MCRWALGRARYARIDTKLYEVVHGPFLRWLVNTGTRSRVGFTLGLVRARYARIDTKLYEVVHGPYLWWFLNMSSRSWVTSSLGLVRARCVFGPLVGPEVLGSAPNFTRLFKGHYCGGFLTRVHVRGSSLHWAWFGPDVSLGLGSGPTSSDRHHALGGCSRAIVIVVREHGFTFPGQVCIGPSSAQMCRWALARARLSLGLVPARRARIATNKSHGCSRACPSALLVVIPGGQASRTCCRVTCWNDVWRVPGPFHVNKAPCPTHRSSSPVY